MLPKTIEWKTIYENPRYEISEEGQVRVRLDEFLNPGRILKRHWEYGGIGPSDRSRCFRPELDELGRPNEPFGSLCVYLYGTWSDSPSGYPNPRKVKRIWKLMERYWPGVPYPSVWRSSARLECWKNLEPIVDKRCKLTHDQKMAIIRSSKSPLELSKIYPVGRRYISQLKHGK